MRDETDELALADLIDRGYDELRSELDATDEIPAVVPTELDERDARDEREARTVLIDAQAVAMEYAIASSLNPDLRVSIPPEGETELNQTPGIRVVKGRMSEPPPIARKSDPIKIIKGTKI